MSRLLLRTGYLQTLYHQKVSRLMKLVPQIIQKRETFLQLRSFSHKSRKPPHSEKPHRILDFVSPKPKSPSNYLQSHIHIIDDLIQTSSNQLSHTSFSPKSKEENSISYFFRLHKQGLKIDPFIASDALSLCRSRTGFYIGTQIHCFAMVNGFLSSTYIGTSLITFYSRCGELNRAYKVFDEMTERNVVSWTAMINGFSKEYDVDMCFHLYKQMRDSMMKANDFTFTSFVVACTGSGCLGHGRTVHCQTIRMGFDSYVHVGNALISMYCKCGEVGDAVSLFRSFKKKDLVSWNSVIAGFSHHGMATEAIELFEEMKQQSIVPDSVTFLSLLSSCRHAGLLNHARSYFDSMIQYGVTPGLDHYSCMVDLLGRAGLIEEARDLISKMPIRPNAIIWGSLLSSANLHGYVSIGVEAAANRLSLEPWSSVTHLQLANLHASAGYKAEAAKVRKFMKENRLITDPGCSWVEIKNTVYLFKTDDRSNNCVLSTVDFLATLIGHMRVVDDNFIEHFQDV